jgi:hypothetical protein
LGLSPFDEKGILLTMNTNAAPIKAPETWAMLFTWNDWPVIVVARAASMTYQVEVEEHWSRS